MESIFPQLEEQTLKIWERNNVFQRSLQQTQGQPEFVFYDGPPFATGLPHYGHILAGTIKDVIGRYKTMEGFHVPRRAGWDCHGVPIEMLINEQLGISTKEEVMEFGISNYNDRCRQVVMQCADEWETTIGRLGRWIDFQNDYKTMDRDFMESVWYVFKTLYQKGLVYQGFKVMPYSTGCTTPLSNFESKLNYKNVSDPSVIVKFPVVGQEDTYLLAWTTTPWTLPSNLALCTGMNISMVKVHNHEDNEYYILSEKKAEEMFKDKKGQYKKGQNGRIKYSYAERLSGGDIEGLEYTPPFPYFQDGRVFRVLLDEYVRDESGTGIVHQAPAFGVDDFRVCMENGIIEKDGTNMVCPVDDDGKFTPQVSDFEGVYVKDADKLIIRQLKTNGLLVENKQMHHEYPFCWRTDTPLIYKAVSGWFINVEAIKEDLLNNNTQTNWVPGYVKDRRFHNWLEMASDWCVSRTRYWGTPLPVWVSEDGSEVLCVGSVDELEELTGHRFDDIHREHVDQVTITSPTTGNILHRIEPVFDCWFESGSMPYGQAHYPFEQSHQQGQDQDSQFGFPADFIAEGLDQTRGWFYTLMVLSTALFNKPAFKNVIVNGLILAENGKKMSKSKKNYPDPLVVVNKYGADSLRLYLINSPAVRAEPLSFSENRVKEVMRELMPWYHGYQFYLEQRRNMEQEGMQISESVSDNVMDVWIEAKLGELITYVKSEMNQYHLYNVVPRMMEFIDKLTNCYIRMNRDRLKGKRGEDHWRYSMDTLHNVLLSFAIMMAPFTPFLAEVMYQKLYDELMPNSVHLCQLPDQDEFGRDPEIERKVDNLHKVIEMVRNLRLENSLTVKRPVHKITIASDDQMIEQDVTELYQYLNTECNVLNLEFVPLSQFVRYKAKADMSKLGKEFRGNAPQVRALIEGMTEDQVHNLESCQSVDLGQLEGQVDCVKIVLGEFSIPIDCIKIVSELAMEKTVVRKLTNGLLIVLDMTETQEVREIYKMRLFHSEVQQLRKDAGLHSWDHVTFSFDSNDGELTTILNQRIVQLEYGLNIDCMATDELIIEKVVKIEGSRIKIGIYRDTNVE